ncbi:type IIL restriction-modification enzyme MmeI [Arsukibacterium perlucidum]|uniref:type IIL restriction-modification enzyme MmeI n=1 Tax=Arsukibacterium perlucidum TaxID=368811 RepID=UPI00036C8698|nr:type IIL restriction-modification enzyme MmeI [Arsukibacterium perlucidum]
MFPSPLTICFIYAIRGDSSGKLVENINPRLVESNKVIVKATSKPLCEVPPLLFGSMPNDGGHLLLDRTEHEEILKKEPNVYKYLKKVIGASEFLNGKERWCLWLNDISEQELQSMPMVKLRVENVKTARQSSKRDATRKLASSPHLFGFISHPESSTYILVPSVSSSKRTYVPLGLFDQEVVSTNLNYIIPGGTLYEFGVLSSLLHNDWMRLVAGRLKSDYRYSASVVYNPFPWPTVSEAQQKQIEQLAEAVLLTREDFPGLTLAQLYDPSKMPASLLEAHQALDMAVDRLYRDKPFKDATDRLSFLLARYELVVKSAEQNTKQKS